jgi:hypothetical protein
MAALSPERIAEVSSEHAQQTALFAWAALPEIRAKYPGIDLMFAVPNGGERNLKVASNLKAEGVKAGVPDVLLPVPLNGQHGLFIEMKWGTNKPSAEQSVWLSRLAGHNYRVAVCWSFDAARQTIIAYYESR